MAKLTLRVADILRMSLYQLLYLDSVPDSAAVNEAVKLTPPDEGVKRLRLCQCGAAQLYSG